MTSRSAAACGLALLALLCTSARAASPDQVRKTIEKAKTWLYSQRTSDGTWEVDSSGTHGDQKTGPTALAVYALLSAGDSHQDKRLIPAIDYLKKNSATGVYALGVRCQVWLALPPTAEVKAAMAKDARALVAGMKRAGEGKGFYDYNGSGKNYSHSRSQYAVLGLWAATQMGIEVPRDYWGVVEKSWIEHQDASGSWNYIFKNDRYPPTPGMTAVGVATLFITQDFLHSGDGLAGNGGNVHNPAIERGMNWLAANFAKVATDEKSSRAYPFSTLYAIERIAVAGGTKYFADVDWYQKGADYLVSHQLKSGGFEDELGFKTASTCLAVLFLSRGSAPIVMSKLDYSDASGKGTAEAHWNQRPRDAANVTRWIGRQVEKDLNWQTLELAKTTADELNDAPIVYIAGNQSLEFSSGNDAKLRTLSQQGGLILGNADGASPAFVTAFKTLGRRLFPMYEFVPLREDHPIYTNQQFARSKWQRKPNVVSLNNGVREFMVLLGDGDPARMWQARTITGHDEAYELPADIWLYAVDRQNVRRRGESYLVRADTNVQPTKAVKLARLQYAGNWDPEPGGWRRMSAILHNSEKLDLQVETVTIGTGALPNYKLAHMTGTTAFNLPSAAREELKKFVDSGGTMIVDAAGGASPFAASAEAEIAAVFPDAAAQLKNVIPPADPLYTAGGYKLKPIVYRSFARNKLGQIRTPQIRGMKVNGRWAILFSREDLTAGLVGQSVDGIVGYDPETSAALMKRMILRSFSP